MSLATRVQPQALTQLPKPGRNPLYARWVRNQPCCVSGRNWGVEFAHTGSRGVGQKASDLDGIPLNRDLHREYHSAGRTHFESKHKICIQTIIESLHRKALLEGIDLTPIPKKPFGLAHAAASKRRKSGSAA